jgi:hypothetical protein
MTVIVKHNKTNTITDWTQAQLNEQIALGNFPSGTTLANIVLPSDWNNDHTLTGLGTMAEQDATAVAITGGTATLSSVTTPSVTAPTNNLTLSAISTGAVRFNTLGGLQAQVTDQTSADLVWTMKGGSSSLAARATLGTNSGAPNFYATGGTIIFTTNGANNADALRITHTASAVNYVNVAGAATGTGNSPTISAQGSDADVNLTLNQKGNGLIRLQTSGITRLSIDNTGSTTKLGMSSSGGAGFQVTATGSQVNFYSTAGSIAGLVPVLTTGASSDTNVSMAFQPKGTGAIDLAAGSSGVNISNGGTVTAITRTSSGGSYTSIPSVAISAPTTAGGVQATASAAMFIQTVSIVNGGTGYAVGNVLTVVGGTVITAATLTVSSVSAGVITGVTVTTGGTSYTVLPSNPVSVTGGSGSGATFNVTSWAVSATITITNAGSGYIEQPTITFSGGGGSGAAAYAVVGNTTITRGLASVSTFHSPSGETLRLSESGGTSVASVNITNGSSSQNTVYLTAYGSATNPNLYLASKGTGNIIFATNTNNTATGTQQAQISHTASAVNYVQVTGSATSGSPTISVQGSDATSALTLTSKGAANINFQIGGSTRARVNSDATVDLAISSSGGIAFKAIGISSQVNYIQAQGNVASSTPILSAQGTDTNIDLALTPKGTGLVRFGTYVAGALLATGYINIKAADGTTYKVLVST